MRRLRINAPLWLPHLPGRRRALFPRLSRDLSVDIAIVGGGITGAAVAWRFAEAGLRVVLLEAGHVGRGSTAASTALLMQEPDEDFGALAERYGSRRTRRIWQLSARATHDFVDTLRRLRIPCDLALRDSVYVASTDEDARRLRVEQRRRQAAGVGGRWMTAASVRQATGFDAPGGIRTTGNAQVDPYRACVGLLQAAAERGAHIFEQTPVGAIRSARDSVRLVTPRATIRADRIVIATGYATPQFKPLLARFRMLSTYVIATRPMSEAERRRVGLSAVMLWDAGRPYHYARWTRDHRLVMGGGDRKLPAEGERAAGLRDGVRRVHEHFLRLYPALEGIPLEWEWEGLFATTPDSLPCIGPHRRYPRHLFALGYGGNGMTFGFMAAGLLLDRYRGVESADQDLFAFSR